MVQRRWPDGDHGQLPGPEEKPKPLSKPAAPAPSTASTSQLTARAVLLMLPIAARQVWLAPFYRQELFIGRTDAEAETPILWPPAAKTH